MLPLWLINSPHMYFNEYNANFPLKLLSPDWIMRSWPGSSRVHLPLRMPSWYIKWCWTSWITLHLAHGAVSAALLHCEHSTKMMICVIGFDSSNHLFYDRNRFLAPHFSPGRWSANLKQKCQPAVWWAFVHTMLHNSMLCTILGPERD